MRRARQRIDNPDRSTAELKAICMQQDPVDWFEIYVENMDRATKSCESVF